MGVRRFGGMGILESWGVGNFGDVYVQESAFELCKFGSQGPYGSCGSAGAWELLELSCYWTLGVIGV